VELKAQANRRFKPRYAQVFGTQLPVGSLHSCTGSSMAIFLMVFLIQSTQNRDTREIHLKLDELILINNKACNDFMELDSFSDD
jgi:low affinity Fe/Cu permease